MKKLGILMLTALVSMGLVAVMGGCGSGGGGGLPKSSPSYAGSNTPAVMDTTTAANFFMVPWQMDMLLSEISLMEGSSPSAVMETSQTVNGTIDGTLTVWGSMEEVETPTRNFYKEEMKYIFDNYSDDGTTFEGVMLGEGSAYFMESMEQTYTGEESVPQGVGPAITFTELSHQNYSDFFFSDSSDEEERSGWATMEFNIQQNEVNEPWQLSLGADIAFEDIGNGYTIALLDAEADLAWDGSFTTYSGHGRLCAEGEAEYPIIGCFDMVFDMQWPENGEGAPVENFPSSGSYQVSTIDAAVMFTYGTSVSDPTCYTISVDEDGNGVYEFENEICDLD